MLAKRIEPQFLTDPEAFSQNLWLLLQNSIAAAFLTEDSPAIKAVIEAGSEHITQAHDMQLEIATGEDLLSEAFAVLLKARKLLINKNLPTITFDLIGLGILAICLDSIAEALMLKFCKNQERLCNDAHDAWPAALPMFQTRVDFIPTPPAIFAALERLHEGILPTGYFTAEDASPKQQ